MPSAVAADQETLPLDLPPSPDPAYVLRVVKIPVRAMPTAWCATCGFAIVKDPHEDRWFHSIEGARPPIGQIAPHEAHPGHYKAREVGPPLKVVSELERRFWDFHEANPQVYVQLVRLARDLVSRGHRKLGIGMLFEVVRWQTLLRTVDDATPFKLNNNHRSRYARLIMDREPDLHGVFDVRELH